MTANNTIHPDDWNFNHSVNPGAASTTEDVIIVKQTTNNVPAYGMIELVQTGATPPERNRLYSSTTPSDNSLTSVSVGNLPFNIGDQVRVIRMDTIIEAAYTGVTPVIGDTMGIKGGTYFLEVGKRGYVCMGLSRVPGVALVRFFSQSSTLYTDIGIPQITLSTSSMSNLPVFSPWHNLGGTSMIFNAGDILLNTNPSGQGNTVGVYFVNDNDDPPITYSATSIAPWNSPIYLTVIGTNVIATQIRIQLLSGSSGLNVIMRVEYGDVSNNVIAYYDSAEIDIRQFFLSLTITSATGRFKQTGASWRIFHNI